MAPDPKNIGSCSAQPCGIAGCSYCEWISGAFACQTCTSGYQLTTTKTCYNSGCPTGQMAQTIGGSCVACSTVFSTSNCAKCGSLGCTSCAAGSYLYWNTTTS